MTDGYKFDPKAETNTNSPWYETLPKVFAHGVSELVPNPINGSIRPKEGDMGFQCFAHTRNYNLPDKPWSRIRSSGKPGITINSKKFDGFLLNTRPHAFITFNRIDEDENGLPITRSDNSNIYIRNNYGLILLYRDQETRDNAHDKLVDMFPGLDNQDLVVNAEDAHKGFTDENDPSNSFPGIPAMEGILELRACYFRRFNEEQQAVEYKKATFECMLIICVRPNNEGFYSTIATNTTKVATTTPAVKTAAPVVSEEVPW